MNIAKRRKQFVDLLRNDLDEIVKPKQAKAIFNQLLQCYLEPHRKFHTLDHIESMLNFVDDGWIDGSSLRLLCVWFHDAVYDPTRNDNEEKSVELARSLIGIYCEKETFIYIADGIMITKTHDLSKSSVWFRESPESLSKIIDADLMGLAATPEIYEINRKNIRQEYSMLTDEQFAEGRKKFLISMIMKPRIFMKGVMVPEVRARTNMLAELKSICNEQLNRKAAEWHSGRGADRSIAEYLGMTPASYAKWVCDPESVLLAIFL